MNNMLAEFDDVLGKVTPKPTTWRGAMEAVVLAEFDRDEVERICAGCARQADVVLKVQREAAMTWVEQPRPWTDDLPEMLKQYDKATTPSETAYDFDEIVEISRLAGMFVWMGIEADAAMVGSS